MVKIAITTSLLAGALLGGCVGDNPNELAEAERISHSNPADVQEEAAYEQRRDESDRLSEQQKMKDQNTQPRRN